jgi:hypothetical protein
MTVSEKPPTTPTFRIIGGQERNEIDGSGGAIITLRLILECVQ